MMNNYNGGMMAGLGWMLLWLVFLALLIVGIVLFIIWLVRRASNNPNSSAADVLKARYAKGEIDKTEFSEKMKDIS
jgi:putative membrane protein